ncbi:MAG: dTDP-glucose 4,6-dehydratase [candidate division Zixibacteria bacterium RBG_16_40_9]|nr:MAG: dTDP-glucose 4,6-dehydratase [candidate division Zixibacteria bacterium RBG_16_40_9]
MRLLVTGGCGFIGSNFVRFLLKKYPDYKIINLDKLTYAGNLENLSGVEKNLNYKFIQGDICNSQLVNQILEEEQIDSIINFAAESHVDRSLYDPMVFVQTNFVGTQVLLQSALQHKVSLFLQISTDEVYGPVLGNQKYKEDEPLSPSSPYAASKASADLLALSYFKSFNLPLVIARPTNNFGAYQFPEKLIPLFISNALEDKSLPIYGDGLYIRDWLYVEDHCQALDLILHKGMKGEIYNISSHNEKTNLEITNLILGGLGKPKSLIKHVPDRPAHDRRYALDSTKLEKELGWKSKISFEKALQETINWYKTNKSWWERVKSGEYQKYYEKHYAYLKK